MRLVISCHDGSFSRLFHTSHMQKRQNDSLSVPSTKYFYLSYFQKFCYLALKPTINGQLTIIVMCCYICMQMSLSFIVYINETTAVGLLFS